MTHSLTAVLAHEGTEVGVYNEKQLINCNACGFIHVNPLPSQEELKAVYDSQFYANDKPDYLSKAEAEWEYHRDCVYAPRFEQFETLLGPSSNPRKILDVGCSGGFFLRAGKERGWETLGLEPSIQASQYCQEVSGINVLNTYFQDLDEATYAEAFDVIHLRFVIEHLPNPIEQCQKAYKLLKPGGLLCVEVPNDFNALQTLVQETQGAPSYWVAIPHHLNYFSFESLGDLYTKTGFEVVAKDTSFPMEFFLLFGDNYVGNDPLGRQCHAKRISFEQTLSQRPDTHQFMNRFYAFLAQEGLGRSVVLFGRKS